MNDYISILLDFFYDYLDFLENKKIIKEVNRKNISIDFFSKSKRGDVSSNFYLIINKKLTDHNFNIKEDIVNKLTKNNIVDHLNISEKGFINIFLNKKYIFNELANITKTSENFFKVNLGDRKKINIEFVSANPTGPIHVAHMRGAVLGDVLSSILSQTGFLVTKEYYVNDAGSQIDILAESLYKRYCQLNNINVQLNENEYPGEYLIDLAKIIYSKYKSKWLKIEKNESIIFFKKFSVDYLLSVIKNDLSLLNINFNIFTFETNIIKNKVIEDLFKILEDKNLLYEGILEKPIDEDLTDWEPRKQLLFKSTILSDDKDRSFKKANGEWTYFANDAAYHFNKYSRNYDKLINIWGADHIGYIQRMKSILKAITNSNDYLEVLICQIVRLIKNNKILKMSKRDGNFVTLRELFEAVGKDPLRYYMISTRNDTPIDFDINRVLEKNKDNPVFYCQYAFARSSSVLRKMKDINIDINKIEKNEILIEFISNEEWDIILRLLSFPFILKQSAEKKEPHRLTNYLEDMSSLFHSFWNRGKDDESLRLIDENNISKTLSKLIWLKAFNVTFKKIFELIGIDSPETM